MEDWIRNKLVQAVALLAGFEAAAWLVSRLVPSLPNLFQLATVFGAAMLGAYVLFGRNRGGGTDVLKSPEQQVPPRVVESAPKATLCHLTGLRAESIPAASVILALDYGNADGNTAGGTLSSVSLTRPFKKIEIESALPWARFWRVNNDVQPLASGEEYPKIVIEISPASGVEGMAQLKIIQRALGPVGWIARLKAIAGPQEPPKLRSVVVVCPFNRVLEHSQALADRIRADLTALASVFEVRFPVHFLFSQGQGAADFDAFVRNLFGRECIAPFGIVFPQDQPLDDIRIGEECDRFSDELSGHWVHLLAREQVPSNKPAIFEFPRNWKKEKWGGSIARFLTSAAPALLETSRGALLRSMHLTGKRSTLKPADLVSTVVDLFLEGFVTNVLAGEGMKASRLAKASLPEFAPLGIAVALVALSGCFAGSWWLNRNLWTQAEPIFASAGDPIVVSNPGSIQKGLQSLDDLRLLQTEIETGQYRKRMPMRWGLYQGERVWERSHELYLAGLKRLIADPVRVHLQVELASVSPGRLVSTDSVRSQLALYHLIGGDCGTGDDRDVRTLQAAWTQTPIGKDQRWSAVARHAEFYVKDLALKNPFSYRSDPNTVENARRFLAEIRNPDQVIDALIGETNRREKPVRLTEVLPTEQEKTALAAAHRRLLSGPAEIESAWVSANATKIESLIRSRNTAVAEACPSTAPGPAQASRPSPEEVNALLSAFGERFASRWLRFLKDTSVLGFASASDAVVRLDALAHVQSPLLAVMAFTANNTANPNAPPRLDSAPTPPTPGMASVAPRFQPTHHIVPPGSRDSWRSQASDDYVQALRSLADAIREVERKPTDSFAKESATRAADSAVRVVDRIRDGFANGTQDVGQEVERILRQPIAYCRPFIKSINPVEGAGRW